MGVFTSNVLMLLLGWKFLGKSFAATTVFSSLFYPIFLEVLNFAIGDLVVTEHIWLNVIFAGLGLGVSLGLVVRGGASTGGLDIPPLILQPHSTAVFCCLNRQHGVMLAKRAVLVQQRLDVVLAKAQLDRLALDRAGALALCIQIVEQTDHVRIRIHLAEAGQRDVGIRQRDGRAHHRQYQNSGDYCT